VGEKENLINIGRKGRGGKVIRGWDEVEKEVEKS
jgi:hypothetical protein